MKKIFITLIVSIALISCSKKESESTVQEEQNIRTEVQKATRESSAQGTRRESSNIAEDMKKKQEKEMEDALKELN